MNRSLTRLLASTLALLALFTAVSPCIGQEVDAGAAGMRGRQGRTTREFLGLGPAPDAAESRKGEPVFKENCSGCHGEAGRGGHAPNLVRSVVVLHDQNDEEIGAVVRAGRTGMPAFPQLTSSEIHSIAQYLKMQVELTANRGTYSQTYGDLRNKVTGDAQAGQIFFAANCSGCHSASKDLAKIGSRFQQAAQLQQRFLWPLDPGPSRIVVTANGEKISGILLKWDDFSVSMRDAAGAYRYFDASKVDVLVDDHLDGHRKLLPKYTNADIHNMTAYLVTLK